MNEPIDVSVVISTYNRCDILPGALESVLAQKTGGVRYEVVVVDNNSTDRTREVIEAFINRGHSSNMQYVFEGRQGLSYGWNAGIERARAPIIAFTDDDTRVARDWVAAIKRAFDEHPEVDFVGGKVLPRWKSTPPAWLTREHWAPLALADHGDTTFYSNADYPVCFVSKSFRRAAFDRVGLFAPELGRIRDGIGSAEDHDLMLRLWRAGRQGMYAPSVVSHADVQPERLTKAYHRAWHTGHGKFSSLMRIKEEIGADGRLVEGQCDALSLFGTPAYIYRELMTDSMRWLAAAARGSESLSLRHESNVRYLASYIRTRYAQEMAKRSRSHLAEVGAFAKAFMQKKASVAGNK
ncbi:MAG: glycosyltransferase [Pyrinomonadaceae bacterium]